MPASPRWRRYLRWRDYVPFLRRYNNCSSRAEFVLDHYADLLEGQVLDVCCGDTVMTYRSALQSRYHGVDISDSYKYDETADAAQHSAMRPDFICNLEQESLPFADGAYDTVLCIGALEHLDDPHRAYDELFRVARRRVIIQLPNNWPNLLVSLLLGRNYTHWGGYGLGPLPKRPGQRHKHFFNLEEACEFLVGRLPAGWSLRRLDCSFEKGNEGLLAWTLYHKAARFTWRKGLRKLGRTRTLFVACARPFFYYPLHALEWAIGIMIWGWQGRIAYHNMTCREIWVVLDRQAVHTNVDGLSHLILGVD